MDTLIIILLLYFFLKFPQWQVAKFGTMTPKDLADTENSYRVTLFQIIGGGAVLLGLYFAYGNFVTARESQITERFTKAIDHLGNKKLEVKLGGLYALERISKESKEEYWPIMEILMAYVRSNSEVEVINKEDKVSRVGDTIQAIITIIGRRKYPLDKNKELYCLFMDKAYLRKANFYKANFERASLRHAILKDAYLKEANFKGANFLDADLENAFLSNADLRGALHLKDDQLSKVKTLYNAKLDKEIEKPLKEKYPALFLIPDHIGVDFKKGNYEGTNFENYNLKKANFEGVNLKRANFIGAYFEGTNLKGADLEGANLIGAKNLTFDQLSEVKTLYNAKLDDELLTPLKEKFPTLFEKLK